LRNLYDPGEYQKLQETLDPGYSKYTSDDRKINKAFDTSDVLANYGYKDGQLQQLILVYMVIYLKEKET
jgi:hypothetical protein